MGQVAVLEKCRGPLRGARVLSGSANLPRLTPISSCTPDPVQANGTWNATTAEADLNWTASTDAGLDHYEIRGVAGPEYDREDESTLASIPAVGPLLYATNFALGTHGNAATYKVYVTINRPV